MFFYLIKKHKITCKNSGTFEGKKISPEKVTYVPLAPSHSIVLLFNKLIAKLATFLNLSVNIFTSLFLPTYEATYTTGYLLPTGDRYREHHDHIWIVLQFVE